MASLQCHFSLSIIIGILVSSGNTYGAQQFDGIIEVQSSGVPFNQDNGSYSFNLTDLARSVQRYLEDTLELNITSLDMGEDRNKVETNSSDSNTVIWEFQGYLDDVESIPACLAQISLSPDVAAESIFEIISVRLKNFPNKSTLQEYCSMGDKNIVSIIDREVACTLPWIHCNGLPGLERVFEYNIYETGSVLYSFYCNGAQTEDCPNWLELESRSECELMLSGIWQPPIVNYSTIGRDNEFGVSDLILPFPLFCGDPPTAGGPPIISLYGDQSWDLLPSWLQTCLKVLNGITLAVFLFSLLTFGLFAELRNAHGKNAMSLVVAVMISLFYTSGYIPLQSDNTGVCVFIGTLLYYFVLVPNYWWTSVSIFLAWTLGRAGIHRMDSSGSRLFVLLSLFGWGMPLVFTLLVLILHISGITVFLTTKRCWINQGWPDWLLVFQTLTLLCVDCISFGLVVYRLRETREAVKAFSRGGKSADHEDRFKERMLTVKVTGNTFLLCNPA